MISARSMPAHSEYPHTQLLQLHPSRIGDMINRVIDILPDSFAIYIRSKFPEWFLPSSIILKQEKKDVNMFAGILQTCQLRVQRSYSKKTTKHDRLRYDDDTINLQSQ